MAKVDAPQPKLAEDDALEARVAGVLLAAAGVFLTILGIAALAGRWGDESLISAIWQGHADKPQGGRPSNPDPILPLPALLVGAALLALSAVVLKQYRPALAVARKLPLLQPAAVLLQLAIWLPVVFVGYSAIVGGERYWWLFDDAMISMRYAHNLAGGNGLVWNPGEPVEGYSNFLWTVVMAVVHLLPIPLSKTALVVSLINVTLAAATIPFLYRLVGTFGGGALAVAATLIAYVMNKSVMAWTVMGMETPLLTFVFVLAVYLLIRESATWHGHLARENTAWKAVPRQSNRPRPWTYLLIAVLPLIRSDALVLAALLYGAALWLHGKAQARRVAIYSVVSLLLPAAHLVFRIAYYGDVLPNTAYLKTSDWDARYLVGLGYVVMFVWTYGVFIGLAVVGALVSRQPARLAILAVIAGYMAFVGYVGGDAFEDFRFFVPVLPVLMAMAFAGIQDLARLRTRRLALTILCIASMPWLTTGYAKLLKPDERTVDLVRIGLLLKQNTPPDTKVADFFAGTVYYFSQRPGVDLLGKNDRHVARLKARPMTMAAGHNKFDFDYSLGQLKPDVVIADFGLPISEQWLRWQATGDFAFSGQLYFNPVFREHYLRNPVELPTTRTIFLRGDWPESARRKSWNDVAVDKAP